MRVPSALGLALAVLAITAAPAFGVGWTQPVAVTPPAAGGLQSEEAQLVLNAQGAQAITWNIWDHSGDSPICVGGRASTRLPGEAWAPESPTPCNAHVQIGPDGTAVVLWDEPGAVSGYSLLAATAAAGSSFGAPQEADNGTNQHEGIVVAVDGQGRVTVAWSEFNAGTSRRDMLAKTQNPDGVWPGTRQTAQTSGSQDLAPMALAIGPKGDAVLAWGFLGTDTGEGLAVSTRAPGADTWTTTTLLGPVVGFASYATPEHPVVAFDPQDRATIVASFRLGPSSYDLKAWSRAADTTAWDPTPQTIPNAASTFDQSIAGLALDSAGNAQVAFMVEYEPTPGQYATAMRAATRPAGSTTWSADLVELPPNPCTTGGFRAATPSVTFDPQDTATIAFDCFDGFGGRLYTRASGATAYLPFTGPANSSAPTIVTDPNGYLIATWTSGGVTYTSVYDAIAPTIDTVTPPSAPVAGEATQFTVTGSDVWGPVTYSIDFGDGSPPANGRAIAHGGRARATVSNNVAHTYSTPGNYTATIAVTDNAANTASTQRAIAVAAASVAAPAPLPPVPGLPDPVAGLSVNVFPIKAPVRVKLPGAKRFIPLTAPTQIRVGAIIDTTKGRVRVTIDNGHKGLDTADFYEGQFKILQSKAKIAVATMQLVGGNFKGCPRAPRVKIAKAKKKRVDANRSVRHLWGEGDGSFRTAGRFSSAAIRGTTWLTDDRCPYTLTRVTKGKVAVRDFVKKKTVVLKKGQRYIARPKARRR